MENRRAKRQKIALACEECRAKKIKCDGSQPTCSSCTRKGSHCSWNVMPSRVELSYFRHHITHLEKRLAELEGGKDMSSATTPTPLALNPTEEQIQRPEVTSTVPSTALERPLAPSRQFDVRPSLPGRDDFAATRSSMQQHSLHGDGVRNAPAQLQFEATQTPATQGSKSDDVSAMIGDIDYESHNTGYFGDSSAAGSINYLKQLVSSKIGSPRSAEPSKIALKSVQIPLLLPEYGSHATADPVVLPPRHFADELLSIYFNLVHPLYPYIDSIELDEFYKSLWGGRSGNHAETVCIAILNTIFALSCQLNESILPEQRAPSAEVFFLRAKASLKDHIWHVGSLQSVQCFLLMGQYLQSTNNAAQCWTFVGLAIRTAQNLGIHLPATSAAIKFSRRRELVRKVWSGCIMMDRVLSMTHGRPSMIRGEDELLVPFPMAVDEECLSSTSDQHYHQRTGRPSVIEFFSQTLKLYQILHQTLLTFYPASKREADGCLTLSEIPGWTNAVLELDTGLRDWERNLPAHLNMSTYAAFESRIFQRQATVLRSRYLHARILLFRPMLHNVIVKYDEQQPPRTDHSLVEELSIRCSISCVRAAQGAIENIHAQLPSNPMLVGKLAAWWYNLLYVYTAAMVLVAAKLRPIALHEVSERSILDSWRCAMEILHHYESYSTSAQRSIAVLKILWDETRKTSEPSRANRQAGDALQADDPSQPTHADEYGHGLLQQGAGPSVDALGLPSMNDAAAFLDFDHSNFVFDLNDMSWLESLP